jgi:hypothetical protein
MVHTAFNCVQVSIIYILMYMSSVFTDRFPSFGCIISHIIKAVSALPLKIESIEPWTDYKLLVGTAEGVLFVYESKDGSGQNSEYLIGSSLS